MTRKNADSEKATLADDSHVAKPLQHDVAIVTGSSRGIGRAIAEAYGVRYRLFKLLPRAHRSCFLTDHNQTIRYTWIGSHPIDVTPDNSTNGRHSYSD
ncbi:thioredoxin domain-containing protein [Halocatena halophila]|uniref:hypothetical protein n=1 Tax=Halocatena halophila TaxID=2814576 RepID=UPI002ED6B2C8